MDYANCFNEFIIDKTGRDEDISSGGFKITGNELSSLRLVVPCIPLHFTFDT
jgi:hypothetical protein